jgi:hypothetical protein
MANWSSATISGLLTEGHKIIAEELGCLNERISLEISSNQLTYTLPSDCIGINRVTWLGLPLEGITFNEAVKFFKDGFNFNSSFGAFEEASFTTAFAIRGLTGGSVITGVPSFFVYTSLGLNEISFFPCSSASIAQLTGNLDLGTKIQTGVVVEYTQKATGLEEWMIKPLVNYYVLKRAFLMEGPGQDFNAASNYSALYEEKLVEIKLYLAEVNSSVDKQFAPTSLTNAYTLPMVRLPSNYPSR